MKNSVKLSFYSLALLIATVSCNKDSVDANVTSSTIVYTSNNSNGNVNAYDFSNGSNSMTPTTYKSNSTAADGVYFDGTTIFQASRSSKGIEGFAAVTAMANLGGLINVSLSLDGSKDMSSPREMAVNGNFYVVADNADVDGNTATADGRLFVYQKSGNSFSLRNVITTDIRLWGITFVGSDLYAVADVDNDLVVYSNFLSNTSTTKLTPAKRIEIEGLIRTHGITYDPSTNTMVLTDIGSATNTQDDGGFHIINSFSTKFTATANAGMLKMTDQIIVSGSNTKMGNPVDVAYNGATKTVFIAEAGNGGGRILSYSNVNTSGNLSPTSNYDLAAASSVYLYKK